MFCLSVSACVLIIICACRIPTAEGLNRNSTALLPPAGTTKGGIPDTKEKSEALAPSNHNESTRNGYVPVFLMNALTRESFALPTSTFFISISLLAYCGITMEKTASDVSDWSVLSKIFHTYIFEYP